MVAPGIGELAALGTAICWTGTALFFEAAGRRIGSLPVNILRLLVALLFFLPVCFLRYGNPLPLGVSLTIWFWLGLSGLAGFTIGDLALFRAFVVAGPRISTTVLSLAPAFAALVAWMLLGETLDAVQLGGMAMTIAGVALVVLDRPRTRPAHGDVPRIAHGVALALVGALGQAVGLVLSKRGMLEAEGIDPMRATMIRVIVGAAGFAALFTVIGWWPRVRAGLRDSRAIALTSCGAFCGPFLGVTLSLVAVRWTDTGIAATLMCLVPVTMIPAAWLLRGDRAGWRGFVGALLAVAGVAVLVLH